MKTPATFLQQFNDFYEDMICSDAASDQKLVSIAAAVRLLLENQVRILAILESVAPEQIVLQNMRRLKQMESEELLSIVNDSQQARMDIYEVRNDKG